jgi:hypothetical protein
MKIYQTAILALAVSSLVSAVHIEISNQYIGDYLGCEKANWGALLEKHW